MNPDDLFEYIDKIIKPALEEYSRERNVNLDDLMLRCVELKNTGLFNYKGKQSTVYNRFVSNNITTLGELFDAYDNNNLDYGKNELKSNHNYYIHDEIDGMVSLLRFKFLLIEPVRIRELLNYQIHMDLNINVSQASHQYGFPGDVCHSVYVTGFVSMEVFNKIDEFYKILKSCGFDQTAVKALIDIAYYQKIEGITLGDFLTGLSLDVISDRFYKGPQELKTFSNILNIIRDICEVYNNKDVQKHKMV